MDHLLNVNNLKVSYHTYGGEVKAVRGVSFSLTKGDSIAIVGESGCGKSVTAKAIMGLLQSSNVEIKHGSEISFSGKNIDTYDARQWSAYRGGKCAMIFQDAMTSLNPTKKVGKQIMQNIRNHKKISNRTALLEAISLLERVGIPQAEKRVHQYPHQFSGGQRQRIMIAIAVACSPEILIADEPTTALDVTILAQIIALLKRLKQESGMSLIMITHDLGVVADIAEKIIVMYCGQIVECGSTGDVFYQPAHPYTQGLLQSVPRLDSQRKEQLYNITGAPPNLVSVPTGCSFADRCPHTLNICQRAQPPLLEVGQGHTCSCWLLQKQREGGVL